MEPAKQKELIDKLNTATDMVMKNQLGFISANIHRSLDGKFGVNYAQWESEEAYQKMLKNKQALVHMKEAGGIATRFEPHLYKVASVHHI